MLDTYEPTETLQAEADAAASAARTALQWGVLVVWLFPVLQLRIAEGAGWFGLTALLCALVSSAVVGQAFLLAQRRRAGDGVPVGFAALAARSTAATLAAGALATSIYRDGRSTSWVLCAGMLVFWFAALLLDRRHPQGFLLGMAGCVVLAAVVPFFERAHVPTTGADPRMLGSLGFAAGVALVAGRRRDAWEAHLERMRAAEVRELAFGQEPDGPQDVVPAGYAAARSRAGREAEQRRVGGAARTGSARPVVLIGDLILVLLGYRGMAAIGFQDDGHAAPTTRAGLQSIETLLLGGGVCLALIVLAVIAYRARRSTLMIGQLSLLVCALLVTFIVAAGFDSQAGRPGTPSNLGPGTVATQTAGGGNDGYCSGGKCYGKAAQEG